MKLLLALGISLLVEPIKSPIPELFIHKEWSFNTSGCIDLEPGWYTPEELEYAEKFMAKCSCGETGIAVFSISSSGGTTGYGSTGKWDNGQCVWSYWFCVKGDCIDFPDRAEQGAFLERRGYF